jgi:hypothetical protein
MADENEPLLVEEQIYRERLLTLRFHLFGVIAPVWSHIPHQIVEQSLFDDFSILPVGNGTKL